MQLLRMELELGKKLYSGLVKHISPAVDGHGARRGAEKPGEV